MIQQVLRIIAPSNNALFGTGNPSSSGTTAVSPAIFNADKLWCLYVEHNGGAATTFYHTAGGAPSFHHLLDPTTPASEYTITWEHLLEVDWPPTAGVRIFAGFSNTITAGVGSSINGIGFYADAASGVWHSYAADNPAGTANSLYDQASGVSIVNKIPNRLKFVIDGPTKTVTWFINGVQVGSWTPVARLERMGATGNALGPDVVIGGAVPAAGFAAFRAYMGSIPLVRIGVGALPAPPPPAAGGGMWLSVN